MPKGTPRDTVPTNLARPIIGSLWINRDGTVYEVEQHKSFRTISLINGPTNITLEEFYKYFLPFKKEE